MEDIIVILLCICFVCIGLYMLMIMPQMLHRPDMSPFTGRLYAHRGLHDNSTDAPENSMPAFAKAVENNYGIELDIQLTKDNEIVVCHDFDLKRVCGADVRIRDITYEELQQYKLYQSDCTVPKLSEVLALVDGKVPLIVEYKSMDFHTELFELANEMLNRYQGVYCVESFNPYLVFWYKKNNPSVVRGILSDSYIKEGITVMPRIVCQCLHNLVFNFIIKPNFVAYNQKYYKDWARTICKKLYRLPAVAWTIQGQQDLEARAQDFDIFIFDSFIPKK